MTAMLLKPALRYSSWCTAAVAFLIDYFQFFSKRSFGKKLFAWVLIITVFTEGCGVIVSACTEFV